MTRSSSLFRWGLAVAMAVLGGWAAALAEEAKPVTLQLQWRPQAQFAGYIVAKEKGFYKEAGLPSVELRWYDEGDPPLKQVVDGKVDFCTAWLAQALTLRAKGARLVSIAQIMHKSSLILVARRSSGIVKPQEMTGRRVSLWGADFDVQPLAFFKKFDVRPVIVPQSYSLSPFLRGAVDVASAMYYNEYHKLLEAGLRPEEIQTFFFSDYGFDFPEDGICCTEVTRRERPEVCAALVSASIKGWAYAAQNETETLDLVMKYCNEAQLATNRNHQRWMLRAMIELITTRVGEDPAQWGTLFPDSYENVAQVLRELGVIQASPPYNEFYRPVLAGGVTRP